MAKAKCENTVIEKRYFAYTIDRHGRINFLTRNYIATGEYFGAWSALNNGYKSIASAFKFAELEKKYGELPAHEIGVADISVFCKYNKSTMSGIADGLDIRYIPV